MKIRFISLILVLVFLLIGCHKKETKSYYWIDVLDESPIILNNNYSYRLQNWITGAVNRYCSEPNHLKGKVTGASAFNALFELEDLLCHTVQNRDSDEIYDALEYYFYTFNPRNISRTGLATEVSLTKQNMWEANDSMMYVYLRLYEVGVYGNIIIDTLYLKEYKFHH